MVVSMLGLQYLVHLVVVKESWCGTSKYRSIVVPQTQNNNDNGPQVIGAPPQQLSAAQPMPSAAAAASSTNELKQPYVDQEILPVVTLKDDDEDQNQMKVSDLHLKK